MGEREQKLEKGLSVRVPNDDSVPTLVLKVDVTEALVVPGELVRVRLCETGALGEKDVGPFGSPSCDDFNVATVEVKVCVSDDQRPDDLLGWIVSVTKVVLKTVGGVTQIVFTKIVDGESWTDDKAEGVGKVVSHAVGRELDGTSTKTVVVDSSVTVMVCAMVWRSVLCFPEAPEKGASVAVST